ncbi:MAG: cupin domain-containing protein [Pyrinomonadaceae bacterium]
MNKLNSNNRLKALSQKAAFLRALCAAKKITAVVKGRQLALAAIVAAVSSVAVAAVLTPSSGVLSAPVVARASFADQTDVKFKVKGQNSQEVINVNNARETVMQQIVIAPGGNTGWHSHPGPVVVLIKSGQMSFYDGDDPTCTVRTYTAGQAFIDSGQGHVHIARNEGTENLELWATYFDVPPSGAFRINAPAPGNCSF